MADGIISSLYDIDEVRQYLNRIGAEPRSLKTAVVREQQGNYYKDVAIVRFTDDDQCVKCDDTKFQPTEQEELAICRALRYARWPQHIYLDRLVDMPQMMKDAGDKNRFVFRNEDGKIVMVQVRIEDEKGKKYIPFTYFDDGKWRVAEPEGFLPLFNADRIEGANTVFIHEGAKGARYCQWMVDGETPEAREALASHPWGKELGGAVHIGWIGGAMSPYRTDWSILRRKGVTRAYIVSDNDTQGKEAIAPISRMIRIRAMSVEFTDLFGASFDLADEFPDKFFTSNEHGRFYIGPPFRAVLHPATYLSDMVSPGKGQKGRSYAVLRDCAKEFWLYSEEADQFVCTEMPEIIRNPDTFNKMMAPFCDVKDAANLVNKAYTGRNARLCYRPDIDGFVITDDNSSAINLHVPTQIKPVPGDPQPFLDFLEYLFVIDSERFEAMKWIATLIARPDIKMGYGLLLVSTTQGVGKTTLGASILAPLVGHKNVSFPTETDIQSQFNGWVAHKRLAIVSEIYSGSSWKAYNTLKSVITDPDTQVNEKYQRPYRIENWCHLFASSNSQRALKMDHEDRRWFYPEVTEEVWPKHKFAELRRWLDNGGLSIIYNWALNFGHYVHPADHAPATARKQEMIDESRTEAQKIAYDLGNVLNDLDQPACVSSFDVIEHCKASIKGKVFDTESEIRKAMEDAGCRKWKDRIKINSNLRYIVCNDKLYQEIRSLHNSECNMRMREAMIKPSALVEEKM